MATHAFLLSDLLILYALIVLSLFWFLDSNFSVLLNFILIYLITGLLLMYLGYEFLGILLLLIYSTGISIIFIITSMILGTKHIGLLAKPVSDIDEENEEREDEVSKVTNQLIFFSVYFFFIISMFFIFNFPSSLHNVLLQHLIQRSTENFITSNSVVQLNDAVVVGFLIYQQYFIYTVIAAFTLLVSLLGSIYVSQDKKKG